MTALTLHAPARYDRLVWPGTALALAIIVAGTWLLAIQTPFGMPALGEDRGLYLGATSRWLAGGPFYDPWQLAGPYRIWDALPILYPPTIIPLLVPFTVLPPVLWWMIPLGIVAAVAWHHRPRVEAVAIIVCLLAWPTTSINLLWTGNPAMWACAALALATVRPAFGPLVLLKPSLGPFALWGVPHRSWWIGLAFCALVALAFLPMWPDYLTVLRNSDGGLLYSVWNVPLMLVPVVAWLGRTKSAPPRSAPLRTAAS